MNNVDLPHGVTQRRAHVNGVELDLLEAGPADGPVVVLAHGFPEGAYSWRHQLAPLAAAGWHVLAPDQRGYGWSSKPATVSDYGIEALAGDLLALVDEAAGPDAKAVFVGHDWGALVMWDLARLHPERCRALVGVSVPFVNWPAAPTDVFKAVYGDSFFYILYFQEVGPAETELGADPRTTLRRILWSASGDANTSEMMVQSTPRPATGTGFLDVMSEPPGGLPTWCTATDLDVYTDSFNESGFFGPVSWYRNLDANRELVKDIDPSCLTMPVWFIGGTRDPVIARDISGVERMRTQIPGFRECVLLDRVGHWTQQEQPVEFNQALLRFLAEL